MNFHEIFLEFMDIETWNSGLNFWGLSASISGFRKVLKLYAWT